MSRGLIAGGCRGCGLPSMDDLSWWVGAGASLRRRTGRLRRYGRADTAEPVQHRRSVRNLPRCAVRRPRGGCERGSSGSGRGRTGGSDPAGNAGSSRCTCTSTVRKAAHRSIVVVAASTQWRRSCAPALAVPDRAAVRSARSAVPTARAATTSAGGRPGVKRPHGSPCAGAGGTACQREPDQAARLLATECRDSADQSGHAAGQAGHRRSDESDGFDYQAHGRGCLGCAFRPADRVGRDGRCGEDHHGDLAPPARHLTGMDRCRCDGWDS